MDPYLEMKSITKIYPAGGLKANDEASLSVRRGEIHALIGENGAGKTTLMNILYGLEMPDSGTIELEGRILQLKSPLDAGQAGIGMVHQHFRLIEEFSAAENVVLGIEPRTALVWYDRRRAQREVQKVIDAHHFNVSAQAKVSSLSVGQKQQVEIVKMLYRRSNILILDEPTSVLTEQEVTRLFDTLRRLSAAGKTIILITHKLDEVLDISDRITVMRRGKTAAVRDSSGVDRRELSRLMVGRSIRLDYSRETGFCSEPVLSLRNVSVSRKGQERPLLDRISFSVSTCEIVGITGVAGNGLSELEDVIAGLLPLSGGSIRFRDTDVTRMSALQLRRIGLSYVPTDRLARGASLEASVAENMIISRRGEFQRFGGLLDRSGVTSHAEQLITDYQIDGTAAVRMGALSGGNIQKAVLARELEKVKDFVLFCEPTWGLDVAAESFIHQKILDVRRRGAAVLLISSNLDEILAVADTVMVLYRGRIVMRRTSVSDGSLSRTVIGEYMLGLRDDSGEAVT